MGQLLAISASRVCVPFCAVSLHVCAKCIIQKVMSKSFSLIYIYLCVALSCYVLIGRNYFNCCNPQLESSCIDPKIEPHITMPYTANLCIAYFSFFSEIYIFSAEECVPSHVYCSNHHHCIACKLCW